MYVCATQRHVTRLHIASGRATHANVEVCVCVYVCRRFAATCRVASRGGRCTTPPSLTTLLRCASCRDLQRRACARAPAPRALAPRARSPRAGPGPPATSWAGQLGAPRRGAGGGRGMPASHERGVCQKANEDEQELDTTPGRNHRERAGYSRRLRLWKCECSLGSDN